MAFKLFKNDDDLIEKELSKYNVVEDDGEESNDSYFEINEEQDNQEIANDEVLEETKVFDSTITSQTTSEMTDTYTNDFEGLDDEDDEYEYVTPHYLGNAILISLAFMIVGAALTFFVAKPLIEQGIRERYIAQGYILTDNATATAADIRQGKTAYVHGKLVEGTYIDIDTSYATATPADILAGYTAYVDGEKITGTIETYKGETQFVPGTSDKTIKKGVYIKNTIIISGDGNLRPNNIKKGVEIFGVVGTYEGN